MPQRFAIAHAQTFRRWIITWRTYYLKMRFEKRTIPHTTWTNEQELHVLPSLTVRQKWIEEKAPLKQGHVVLVTDDNLPRAKWTLGKIWNLSKVLKQMRCTCSFLCLWWLAAFRCLQCCRACSSMFGMSCCGLLFTWACPGQWLVFLFSGVIDILHVS